MNNKTAFVTVGKTVGGSSATNGQFFDRGSRHDYDAWDEVANDGSKSKDFEWNWRGIYPYFKKVRNQNTLAVIGAYVFA